MTKVSKGFNAKNFCGKRRYHYLLPTYMLMDNKVTNEKLSAAYKIQGPIAGAGYEGVNTDLKNTLYPRLVLFVMAPCLYTGICGIVLIEKSHPRIISQSSL